MVPSRPQKHTTSKVKRTNTVPRQLLLRVNLCDRDYCAMSRDVGGEIAAAMWWYKFFFALWINLKICDYQLEDMWHSQEKNLHRRMEKCFAPPQLWEGKILPLSLLTQWQNHTMQFCQYKQWVMSPSAAYCHWLKSSCFNFRLHATPFHYLGSHMQPKIETGTLLIRGNLPQQVTWLFFCFQCNWVPRFWQTYTSCAKVQQLLFFGGLLKRKSPR